MQMGQFIDHDLTHSPASEEAHCCLNNSRGRPWTFPTDPFNDKPDDCFPIEISQTDEFWGRRGRRCMQFSRSDISPPIPVCEAGKREQRNALTHWLDGSNIYGSTDGESLYVRDTFDRS